MVGQKNVFPSALDRQGEDRANERRDAADEVQAEAGERCREEQDADRRQADSLFR